MGYIKPKKRKKRLQSRINHFMTDRAIRDMVNRCPGSFTKPGSLNKS